VPGGLFALLELALYVEPRSAALPTQAFTFEKLRGAIHHSHSIMKHNIHVGGMDATKELIFKAFNLCVLDALVKLLESYYGILRWFE
jgi:hypothetical protein